MINTISFDAEGNHTMKLIQRQHDGRVLLIVKDPDGKHESIDDEEAFISPVDLEMLIKHYRACKRGRKPIF